MKMKIHILSILSLLLGSAAAVSGSITVVQFGGDYVDANVNFSRGWTGTVGGVGTVAFDNSQPLLNLGGSANVYGAAYREVWSGGNANLVNNDNWDGTNDILQLDGTVVNTDGNRPFAAMFYWRKPDFLNGGDATTLSIGTGSQLTFRASDGQAGGYNMHWLVQGGDGTFYLSQTGITLPGGNVFQTHTADGTTLLSLAWVEFDPTSSIYMNPGSASAVVPDFSDVIALGVYAHNAIYGGRIQARVTQFEAVVIPEPSFYAALFGLLSMGMVIWRRRAQKKTA